MPSATAGRGQFGRGPTDDDVGIVRGLGAQLEEAPHAAGVVPGEDRQTGSVGAACRPGEASLSERPPGASALSAGDNSPGALPPAVFQAGRSRSLGYPVRHADRLAFRPPIVRPADTGRDDDVQFPQAAGASRPRRGDLQGDQPTSRVECLQIVKERLNKGVSSEFDFSNVKLKQSSPFSQSEIRNSALKTVKFR